MLCKPLIFMAGATRLELATSGVTGYSSGFCIMFEILYLQSFQNLAE